MSEYNHTFMVVPSTLLGGRLHRLDHGDILTVKTFILFMLKEYEMAELKTLIRPLTAYIKGIYTKHMCTQFVLRLCVRDTFDSVVFGVL